MEAILQLIPIIAVFGLIILFFISFTHFIKKLLINSSARTNNANEIGKKLDMLIEQNEKIISLLKEKK
ncbi:DUF4083 domain-containing protein [Solibacillus sp. MA9]|uniref:DUF4083 domain-containing protein n=1 Tax=Solibacillus palustris TaxID=2908203 RepID=A0ABS9UF91_9BACL|nr:DUF4083 family protein [Solibacillus sp. MA9]MCH7322613.1 DUF4083 domain-containing protein [Solibacillus sp. MA9]